MFKKIITSIMALGLSFIMAADISWGDMFRSGNSLLFFGEPDYPTEK